MNDPTKHSLWPAFLKFVNECASWGFVGEHRNNDLLSLWGIFLAGAEAEQARMLDAT